MMKPDPETQASTSELEQQGTTSVAGESDQNDEDVFDQVLDNAERVCCGRFRGSGKPEDLVQDEEIGMDSFKATENAPEEQADCHVEHGHPDTEDFDGHNLMTESPNENFAVESPENDMALPKDRKGDRSAAKESVEIQAHFDDDDAPTITSDNGLDTSTDKGIFGMFVTEDETKSASQRRRKSYMIIAAIIVALILVIGLSAGLANGNKRKNERSVSQSAALNGNVPGSNTGNEAVDNASTSDSGNTSTPVASPADADIGNGVVDTVSDGNSGGDEAEETSPPVTSPTDAVILATASPTTSPTDTSTSCDRISVSSTCYEYFREEPVLTFNVCQPVSQDWIAIYPAGPDMNNFDYPELEWRFTCGDQDCDEALGSSTIGMDITTPPGLYQAYLFSNEGGDQGPPYAAIAASEIFEITADTCN